MPEPTDVGLDEAKSFLLEHLGRDPGTVELVGEGAWSRCFGFWDGAAERVIRFGRHRSDFEKDRRAASFTSAALPVPRVFEVGEAADGFFAISTRAHGVPLESLGVAGWRSVLPSLWAALDALRRVPVPDDAGFGDWFARHPAPHGSWRDFLLSVEADTPDRRTHGWRPKLAASAVGDAPFERGLERLDELASGVQVAPSVVHADLINRNVLVQADRISAVFDWGCSFHGDFLYDIAWLEFWSPWRPDLQAIDVRSATRSHYDEIGLEVEGFDERMRCCLIHIGLDHQAYCAFADRHADLAAITERTRRYCEPPA